MKPAPYIDAVFQGWSGLTRVACSVKTLRLQNELEKTEAAEAAAVSPRSS